MSGSLASPKAGGSGASTVSRSHADASEGKVEALFGERAEEALAALEKAAAPLALLFAELKLSTNVTGEPSKVVGKYLQHRIKALTPFTNSPVKGGAGEAGAEKEGRDLESEVDEIKDMLAQLLAAVKKVSGLLALDCFPPRLPGLPSARQPLTPPLSPFRPCSNLGYQRSHQQSSIHCDNGSSSSYITNKQNNNRRRRRR